MLSPRYLDALEYAAKLHAKQVRKGSDVPYISHLYGVSALVMSFGGDEDAAIAGLLHDGPEDQGGLKTLNEIRAKYGDVVADIVERCSDSLVDTAKRETKQPWADRKLPYIQHLANGDEAERNYHLVTGSDKLHNLLSILRDYRDIEAELWSRFNSGRDNCLWYYRSLIQALMKAQLAPQALLDAIQQAYAELEALVMEKEGFALQSDYQP